MNVALIGLVGIFIGILLNEYFRRSNRIENYSSRVFEKRLEIYEELYQKVSACSEVASDLINNPNHSSEDRHNIVSEAILSLAQYCDDNAFYLNEEATIHCVFMLMSVEKIYDIKDQNEKDAEIKRFWNDFQNAKRIIKKESGIEDINKLFRTITKAKHSSPAIDYYKKLKKEKEREKNKQKLV